MCRGEWSGAESCRSQSIDTVLVVKVFVAGPLVDPRESPVGESSPFVEILSMNLLCVADE